ncbi:MAG: glycoside hydrolase family 3 C-terminal domain-containing protein [Gemmiger sp.]|nr:glycoside hydrolase family 3 C-terminal domain-containing protein [Gemmiger sp.]
MQKVQDTAKERAQALVARMTLAEKTALLSYRSPPIDRLGIPAYNWWNEALHGVARAGTATVFPQVIGLAASFDTALVHRVADAIATEGRAKYNENQRKKDCDIYKGLTFWCPNVNIFRDPRWGRGHETFGEDPFLTARLGVAYIQGLQGEGATLKSAACAKHFAAHSGPEEGRHSFDSVVSQKDLWETYLPAFEACVKEARVEGVMGAYNSLDGVPCCGNKTLLQEILREKWGFDGYVVSDCGAIADFHLHHGVTATEEQSAAMAVDAGCDLNCGTVYLRVMQAVQDGLLDEAKVDTAATHLLATRIRLGMLDGSEYDTIPYEVVECPAHLALSEEAARRSMVLLKNNGLLPLDKKQCKTIGVIGPDADSRSVLQGNYFGTSSHNTTLLEGIQQAVGADTRVLYAAGSHLYRAAAQGGAFSGDRRGEALSVAERSDVVILCLGLDPTIEGEQGDASNEYAAGDKRTLGLPTTQQELLEAVLALGRPTVLCVTAGSALDLQVAAEKADAILQVWYPGARGGKAMADLLFGKASPSAKLPVTFYRTAEDLPAFEEYAIAGRTYRYFQKEPLYPFGYGLNYGDIRCTGAQLERAGEGLCIHATLTNSGRYAAGDVLQVYVKVLESAWAVPNYSLCAFQPFALQPGESRVLTLGVGPQALEVVNDAGERVPGGKRFRFYVGCSQPDARSVALCGKQPVELAYTL